MAVSTRTVDPEAPPPAYEPEQNSLLSQWSDRRKRGLHERRPYDATWKLCQSFLAGRQWVRNDPESRNGRVIDMPNPQRRERYTANVLTQYVQTVIGKLYVEDLRPDVLFARSDIETTAVAEHTRQVSKFIWESETAADDVAYEAILGEATFGTSAVRCFYDGTKGQIMGTVPIGPDGDPITDMEMARLYVAQAQEQGQQVEFMDLHEGQVNWESLLPTNLIPPPGIAREKDFPWLIVEIPMDIEEVKRRWPDAANRVQGQALDYDSSIDVGPSVGSPPASTNRQKDGVLVSVGYQMPTTDLPLGAVFTWVDKTGTILQVDDKLPYRLHGNPHHGIIFFHYHRVPGRFWSVGVVEPLIGPQYQRNRARSQMIEMKDRNLGRVYAKKGTITNVNKPVGKIMELIEIPLHADFPQETNGVPVGPWIENESRMNDEDMDKISGLREVTMGQQPGGVTAYAAMALLAEQDDRRVGPILKRVRSGLADLMVISLELARSYWPDEKQMAIAGKDGMMEVAVYKRAMLPDDFYIDVSRAAPLPKSPAAEAQKIFDIFNAAVASGQPLPIDWLVDSLAAGKAMPIPRREESVQREKAQMEDMLIAQGQLMQPSYYDDDYLHITVHRESQIELIEAGDMDGAQREEMHIQMHVMNAQQKKPTSSDSVPQNQGGRGVEAQNGMHANMQGAAQQPGVTPNGAMNG